MEIRDGRKVVISQEVIKLNLIYGCTKAFGRSRGKDAIRSTGFIL